MSDKYFAIGSIGTFLPNEEVVGLDGDRYAELVELGKVRVEQGEDNKTKPLTKMKVNELQNYIADNGGDFELDDNKAVLLEISQVIEDQLNNNQE